MSLLSKLLLISNPKLVYFFLKVYFLLVRSVVLGAPAVIVVCFAIPVLRDEARGHRPHASDVLYDVVGSLVGYGSL